MLYRISSFVSLLLNEICTKILKGFLKLWVGLSGKFYFAALVLENGSSFKFRSALLGLEFFPARLFNFSCKVSGDTFVFAAFLRS